MPVFGTIAAASTTTASPRSTRTCAGCSPAHGLPLSEGVLPAAVGRHVSTGAAPIIPPARVRYLAEIAETVRGYHADTARQVAAARRPAAGSPTSARSWPPPVTGRAPAAA